MQRENDDTKGGGKDIGGEMSHHMRTICPNCGGIKDNRAKLCQQCQTRLKPNNKGKGQKGWYLNSWGYIMIHLPMHPNSTCDGFVREHRVVMEEYLCRTLKREEHIHHKNGMKTDNRLDNLVLTSNKEHYKYHLDALRRKRSL